MHTMAPLPGHPSLSSKSFEELVTIVKLQPISPLQKQYRNVSYFMDGGYQTMVLLWQHFGN